MNSEKEPSLWEKLKNFTSRGKFKGFFDHQQAGRPGKRKVYHLFEKSWRERYTLYDQWTIEFPEIKSELLTIGGQVMADGIFLKSAVSPTKGEYPRAEEAMAWCEDVNRKIGLDVMIHETAVRLCKYGSVFWEKTWTPEFDVRIIPNQKMIEPAEREPTGDVVRWRQLSMGGTEVASWTQDEIVHFSFNVGRFEPYGTSLLDGLDGYLNILHDLLTDTKEYMHKNAWPSNMFTIGDEQFSPTASEVSDIESKVKNFEPGDNYVTSYPITHTAVGAAQAETRMLPKVLEFVHTSIIDGLMTVPVSMQNQRSKASAEEMGRQERSNLILPVQRLLKRKIEREVYWPYLEDEGFSFRVVPSLEFEAPEAHRDEDVEYFTQLVHAGIISAKTAAKELGFEEEEMAEEDELTMKREEEGHDHGHPEVPPELMAEIARTRQRIGKSYIVTELDKSD